MKRYILYSIFFAVLLKGHSQGNSSFDAHIFYGNIIEHAPELKPLIKKHPTGIILQYNKHLLENSLFGNQFNFPDAGYTAIFQDFKTEEMGEVYSILRHYNFYLLNRNNSHQLKLTSGFGLGYATSPFDKEENPKNWAIGSKVVAAVLLKLQYQHDYLIGNLGVHAGFSLIHYSNGSFNVPNLGINTIAATVGVHYDLNPKTQAPDRVLEKENLKEPIHINAVLRAGFNESLVNGSGLFPFYTLSAYGDKKLTNVSTITFGADFFFPVFMKDYIEWDSIQNDEPISDADWKRAGLFAGYEMNMHSFSVIGQIGYHVYYPYEYVSRIYERFGFKKRFGEYLFAALSLKINMFRAEGLEFGLGYRF